MSPLATYLVETVVTLLAVTGLAVLVLYGGRRLGVGRQAGPLELVGRLPIDARRAVYLVRVGEVIYILGASESGLTRLGEVPAASVPAPEPGPGRTDATFSDVLSRVLAGDRDTKAAAAPIDPKGERASDA